MTQGRRQQDDKRDGDRKMTQGRRQKDDNLELVDKITQQDARTERFF
jgi:hypothetical protein